MPAAEELNPYPEERVIVPCCVHLRTKTMYFMPDEMRAGPGYIKLTNTGTYWCDRTSAPLGPDNVACHPTRCQSLRGCYDRPAELSA